MCFVKTPKIETPAQPPAPAAQGATSLVLGGGVDDDEDSLRNRGLLGRLALRLGRGRGRGANTAQSVAGVGGSSGGSSSGGSTSGGSPSGGGSSGGSSSGGGFASPSRSFKSTARLD